MTWLIPGSAQVTNHSSQVEVGWAEILEVVHIFCYGFKSDLGTSKKIFQTGLIYKSRDELTHPGTGPHFCKLNQAMASSM